MDLVLIFVAAAISFASAQSAPPAAPKPESFAGTWAGTWEGAGSSGGFELTLEQAKDGPLTGKVSVTGEPTYTAVCKSVVFDGKKMTAKVRFHAPTNRPKSRSPCPSTGTSQPAPGRFRPKADGSEVVSGTLTLTRKPRGGSRTAHLASAVLKPRRRLEPPLQMPPPRRASARRSDAAAGTTRAASS